MRKSIAAQAVILIFLSACGGGGDGQPEPPDYSGTWDVNYHLVSDECGLVAGGIPGFVDQHVIDQSGSSAEFSAISALIVAQRAVVREDGSLLAEETLNQDIFGDGTPCRMTSRVEYTDLRDVTATTLYDIRIACDNGYRCESSALGEALRQPGEPPEVIVEDGTDG